MIDVYKVNKNNIDKKQFFIEQESNIDKFNDLYQKWDMSRPHQILDVRETEKWLILKMEPHPTVKPKVDWPTYFFNATNETVDSFCERTGISEFGYFVGQMNLRKSKKYNQEDGIPPREALKAGIAKLF